MRPRPRRNEEAVWQQTVNAALVAHGWRWFHHQDSRRVARVSGLPPVLEALGPVGFPDLIALRGERLLAIELKAAQGRMAPAQSAWLAAFLLVGAEVYIWRPADREAMERALA